MRDKGLFEVNPSILTFFLHIPAEIVVLAPESAVWVVFFCNWTENLCVVVELFTDM